MTDFEKIKQYRRECEIQYSAYSDTELIQSFNGGVRIKAWGFYRAAQVDSLREEILRRDFDSSILFDKEDDGKVISFKLSHKVVLIDNKLVRFEEFLN